MDAGDGAFGFAAPAAKAEDVLWRDMVEFAFVDELINVFLDFWGFKVFYGQWVPLSWKPCIGCSSLKVNAFSQFSSFDGATQLFNRLFSSRMAL